MFKDPTILTPGYYYFSPPGTPFYPKPHNLGSRNWVTADFTDPPLGEASGKQTYRKGGFPVLVFPPAVQLGDDGCIQSGEMFPLPVVNRVVIDGVDSRCWTAQGVNPPDPGAAILLPSASVASVTPGKPGFSWPDSGYLLDSPLTSVVLTAPLGGLDPRGLPGLVFPVGAQLPFPRPVSLPGDFALVVAGFIPAANMGQGGLGVFPLPPPDNALLQVFGNQLLVANGLGGVGFATGPNFGKPHLWGVTRTGPTVTVYLDGVFLAAAQAAIPPAFAFAQPVGLVGAVMPGAGPLVLDIRLFDSAVSAPTFASLLAALLAMYPPLSTVSVSCGSCTLAPATWTLTVSGYTGAASPLNGSWNMPYTGACVWQSSTVSGGQWSVGFTAGTWIVQGSVTPGISSIFSTADASWNCLGPNTVPHTAGSGDAGAPTQVSVAAG